MAALCLARRTLCALALSLSILALAPVAAGAQTTPIELTSEWLRGSWGQEAGAQGMVAAHLGDGDPDLEWVAAASLYGSDPYGDPEADHWYVVDRHAATGFAQVWRSGETFRLTSLAAGDVDGDGIDEIVVGADGSIEIWDGWPLALDRSFATPASRIHSLRVADLDLDGTAEIVFVDSSNPVYVLDAVTGAVEHTWTDLFGPRLAIGQVDGDPALEVIADGRIVDGATGVLEFESSSGWGGLFVEVAELDGTGPREIVAGWDGRLSVVSWTGSSYAETVVIQPTTPIHAVAVADVDGDGTDEIVTGDEGQGLVRIHEPDGTEIGTVTNPLPDVNALLVAPLDDDPGVDILWSAGAYDTFPHGLFFHDLAAGATEWQSLDGRGWRWMPAWGDVDADGDPELVVSTLATGDGIAPGRYFVHQPDGALEHVSALIGSTYGLNALALGQLDADPQLEIVLAAWNETSPITTTLHVIDGATHVQEYEILHGDEVIQLAVADVDQDGDPEIVAAGGTTLVVYDGAFGEFEWSPDLGTYSPVTTLAIGDFDAASSGLEIVVGADTGLHAYNGTTQQQIYPEAAYGTISSLSVQPGTPDVLWVGNEQGIVSKASWDPFSPPETPLDTGFDEVRSLVTVDLNRDGDDDFVFVSRDWNTFTSALVVLSGGDLAPLAVHPLPEIEAGVYDSVVVDDFDGDGWTEIWVNRAEGGFEIFEVFVDVPQVSLISPTPPVDITDLDEIALDAVAVDPTDGDLTASITWTSDLDGLLATGGQGWVGLSPGLHTITAEAYDFEGNRGWTSFQATVTSTAPVVTLATPETGLLVGLNTAVGFSATALDGEDGDLSQDLVWMSDQIGTIGYGPSLSVWSLPAGTHVVTASVTDSNFKSSHDTVVVTVADPAACAASWLEDFESAGLGWTTSGLWHLTDDPTCTNIPPNRLGTFAYFGTQPQCSAVGGGGRQQGDLRSPVLWLGQDPDLRAYTRWSADPEGAPDQLEIWVEETDGTRTLIWAWDPLFDPQDSIWENFGPLSLVPWQGQEIRLIFRFDSVDAASPWSGGWFLDDIEVLGTACPPANTVPVVTVESPAYGETVPSSFTLVGSVVDPEETDPTAGLEWWSGGQLLGTGGSLPVTLPAGTVYIEARFTDSSGAPAFDGVQVTVVDDQPPTVEIIATTQTEFYDGTPMNLYGSADDLEDGDLSAAIQWTSDLDGALGTGGWIHVTLSAGTHTLTASVTDSLGQTVTDTIQRIVQQSAPVVTFLAPATGFRAGLDTAFDLSASAVDSVEGDLSASLVFASDLDGPLGAGPTLTVFDLTAGIHTITASVTDSESYTGSASVTVEVADPATCGGEAWVETFETGASGWSTSGLWHLASDTSCTTPGSASPVVSAYFGDPLTCTYDTGGAHGGELVSPSFVVAPDPALQFHHRWSVEATTGPGDKPEVLVEDVATGQRTRLWQLGTQNPDSPWVRWGTTHVWTQPGLSSALAPFEGQEIRLVFRFDTVDDQGNDYLGWLVDDVTVTGRTCLPANTPPSLDPIAPDDGDTVETETTLVAVVVDPDETDPTADLEWWLGTQLLGTGGNLSVTLPAGPATIEARYTDSAGYRVSAFLNVTVIDNQPPTVNLWLPTALELEEGESIRFTGDASDPEDGDLSAALQWSSDLDGPLGTGAEFYATLSAGDHTITLSVTDSFGASASTTKQLTIRPNTPPVVQLMEPADFTALEGDTIRFDANATDSVDGDLSASIEWSSSLDGVLGTGSSLLISTLSRGVHTLNASATDSLGATGSASQTVTVDGPPAIAITAPANGALVVVGDSVTFTGVASDAEDGDLSALVDWSSDLDGALGVGASVTATPSVGQHTIIAQVTDSQGQTATALIALEVEPSVPSLFLLEPSDGATVSAGDPVSFLATADDAQDGNLDADIAWTSSIDGKIGYGSAFDRRLAAGVHTVTASVTDSDGETDSATITLTVEPAPEVTIVSPLDGGHATPGGSVTLTGTALGTDDLDASASIVWWSTLDGTLGTGASISVPLTTGLHTLTATATDGLGRTGTAQARLFVTADAPPVVSLDAPLDRAWCTGPPCDVTLAASAIDPEDGDLTTTGVWTSDLEGVIDADGDGLASLGLGLHTLTFTVTDGAGNTMDRSVLYRVLDANDAAPVVAIAEPVDGAFAKEGDTVLLAAGATDGDLGDVSDFVSWTLLPAGTPLGTGSILQLTAGDELPVGSHTLEARLVDAPFSATDTVTLTLDANPAPVIDITSPADGSTVVQGDPVIVVATATDEDDGDLTDALAWSSDLDGPLGTGGYFDIDSGNLTVGIHVLTVQVTDSRSATATATVTVTIHRAPTVAISSPADGTSVLETDPVTFGASASDPDDGDLTAGISWTSSLDGALGTGGSFTTTALSVGSHTVTASVTDSNGETRTDTVTVTVAANTAPTVSISSPSGPLAVVETDPVSFAATASDAEDGDLSASLVWTSDRDGLLATGASFGTSALSVGVHEIRATVADRLGAEGSAGVTVTVEANTAPTVALTAPADGTQVTVGDTVTFAATAGDAQDGDLSASVVWTSSLDGALGTGSSVATSSLSVGAHTVTATVADRHGLGASAQVTLVVRPQPVTVSFTSIGTEDGWILESSENSGAGGSFDNLEQGGKNRDVETIRVGDDRKDEQYRSILSFDTSSIPDGAEIQSASLVIRRGNLDGGDPFATHGDLVIDVKTGTFGTAALEASDFQAVADALAAGMLSQPAGNGGDATAVLDAAGRAAVHPAGRTQMRLRFATDDDDDRSPDVLGFYAGETSSAQLPELVVTYQE